MKKNTIYSLIAIAIIIGGGLLSIYTFFGSFNPFYVVVSGSMIPKINIGDIVIIKNNSLIPHLIILMLGTLLFLEPRSNNRRWKTQGNKT